MILTLNFILHHFNLCIYYLENSLCCSTSEVQVIQNIYFIIHCNFRCNKGKLPGEVKKDHCAAIIWNITSMPDGKAFRCVQCDNCDEWFHDHYHVIAASNNLLALYKKDKTRKLYLPTNFGVLNLIFPPWSHQPTSHLTYCINFKNISDNSKSYLQELFKFRYWNFWSQTTLLISARRNRENWGNMDQSA